jgi:hypothetical protein
MYSILLREPLSMSTQIQANCFSNPFTVYSAKKVKKKKRKKKEES